MDSTISTKLKEYYEARSFFGTTVWIHCFHEAALDIAPVARACWQKAQRIQDNMNVYAQAEAGNLAWLNSFGHQGVRVQEDVFKILKLSLEHMRLTHGAYDVTIFPLVQLWKAAAKEGRLPSNDLVAGVKANVGYQQILLQDPDLVFFLKKGVMVDLGSPASGYFCDEVAGIMDAAKIQHFMVDGGGEIFCRGKDKGGIPWRVGVQDPFDKNKLVTMLELDGKGVSTSGSYEKFSLIEGRQFAHIIDPASGYPQEGAASATVIAATTQIANELSTAFCVLGGARSVELAVALGNVEALVIENNNGVITRYQTACFCGPATEI